jgi:transposase-like protein
MVENPQASLREVARQSGIAVGTARSVRRELSNAGNSVEGAGMLASPANAEHGIHSATDDPAVIIDMLRRDPALRYTETGRRLLRWLGAHAANIAEGRQLVTGVSPHCASLVNRLARDCAAAWAAIAEEAEHLQSQSTAESVEDGQPTNPRSRHEVSEKGQLR